MLASILKDVNQRIPDFPKARQRPRMESVRKHPPTSLQHPIQCSRDPDRQRPNPVAERLRTARLGNQVQMPVLNRKLDHAKSVPMRRGNRLNNLDEHPPPPNVRNLTDQAQRRVLRFRRLQPHPRPMRNTLPPPRTFSPRAFPCPTPRAELQAPLFRFGLHPASHLIGRIYDTSVSSSNYFRNSFGPPVHFALLTIESTFSSRSKSEAGALGSQS
jgi:hypothetical protein